MLNGVFFFLVAVGVCVGALRGTLPAVGQGAIDAARTSVDIALTLAGQMTLWLGLMGILKRAGAMEVLARWLRAPMRRLFPDVPENHPAMGSMVLNLSANILGLDNAATPFGLKAMRELDTLSRTPGTATNAMTLFLVINTSGLAVIPTTAVALRAAAGSHNAAGIILPSIVGTLVSTTVAIAVAVLLSRLPRWRMAPGGSTAPQPPAEAASATELAVATSPAGPLQRGLGIGAVLVAFGALGWQFANAEMVPREAWSAWILPFLILGIAAIGVSRGTAIFESFVEEAKDAVKVAISILPTLVGMLVAIGMFRQSGALEAITEAIGPVTRAFGLPPEALPMALVRPLSGSASRAVLLDTLKASGPDSFVGYLVSLISGTSETTFYVLAVYFGAIKIRNGRHTLVACILADLIGLAITVAICHAFFGSVA